MVSQSVHMCTEGHVCLCTCAQSCVSNLGEQVSEKASPCSCRAQLQEKVIQQLTYAQIVFPALAVSRFVDALPGILQEDGNTYAEIVTIISAIDPLLVGIFAYGTASAMKKILEREKQGDETVEEMRYEKSCSSCPLLVASALLAAPLCWPACLCVLSLRGPVPDPHVQAPPCSDRSSDFPSDDETSCGSLSRTFVITSSEWLSTASCALSDAGKRQWTAW